jgi:hypothetical protein
MICPKCGYPTIPLGARFCPECGAPVEIAARVEISQEVRENLGRVIGVQTAAIHGDVYGGDIYEVQVYALSGEGRAAGWRRFLVEGAPPYKFLAPYSARDQALFKGRQAETELVVRRIGEQRVVVLYGPPGAGKTSLLAAGVIPALIQAGALVVHIQDYARPAETIRAALAANAEQVPILLPDPPTLPDLARAVYQATQGSLVLIFDQFERLFEPPIGDEQRAAFVAGLAGALAAVGPEYLRVIIAVREEVLGHIAALSGMGGRGGQPSAPTAILPDLLLGAVPLAPLTGRQAQAAIEEPLAELNYPVSFVGDLVPAQVVPDLDELTPDTPDRIEPPQLQIVCHWLYQVARGRHPPHIDPQLYAVEAKGADGILARYLEETLRTQLAGQEALARQLLAAMAAPDAGRWITPARLAVEPRYFGADGAAPEQVRDLLDRLEGAGLLVSRRADGGREYAFTSFCVAQEARRLAGPEVERRYQAGDELERIWAAWLARDALATRGQLRYLAQAGAHLTPPPVKVLLLLHSAVVRDEPAELWLAWLRNDAGRALLGQLEMSHDPADRSGADGAPSPSALAKATLLLGLADVTPPEQPVPSPGLQPPLPPNFGGIEGGRGVGRPFGPVAWAAVTHPDPTTRQTAGLALTVTDRHQTLDRLNWALKAGAKGWQRRDRQAELRGALADADPEIARLNADLPLLERAGVWLWRVRRRLIRERYCIAGLTLGGAIGAGLGLALLRGLTAALTRYTVGLHFAMNFYWGAILGAALTLGFVLAGPITGTVGPSWPTGQGDRPEQKRPGCREAQTRRVSPGLVRPGRGENPSGLEPAVALGTLLFGLAHLLIALFIGLDLLRAPLVALLGFVGGMGLSLGLACAVARSGCSRLAQREDRPQQCHLVVVSLIAALAFVFTQVIFIVAGGAGGESLAIVWPGRLYRADLARHAATWWQWVMNNVPGWYHYVALLDAALAGGMLAAGTAIGVRLAGRWLARWQELMDRAGE